MFPPRPPLPGPTWWMDGAEVYPSPEDNVTMRLMTECPLCESIFDKPSLETMVMECPCCLKPFFVRHTVEVFTYKKEVLENVPCVN